MDGVNLSLSAHAAAMQPSATEDVPQSILTVDLAYIRLPVEMKGDHVHSAMNGL